MTTKVDTRLFIGDEGRKRNRRIEDFFLAQLRIYVPRPVEVRFIVVGRVLEFQMHAAIRALDVEKLPQWLVVHEAGLRTPTTVLMVGLIGTHIILDAEDESVLIEHRGTPVLCT